ncbi:MAG TPA: hypothetical protein VNH84_10850 [Candidatus Saccharimonadales bacterium]|nr:hypothetical protein [Candidatus Saccharimonadales bacterium]
MAKGHSAGFRHISMTGKPSGYGAKATGGHDGSGGRSASAGPCGASVSPHRTVQGCKEHTAQIGTREPHKATRERGST